MVKWTKEQASAIGAPHKDIRDAQTLLVAAAAGSGKTAVLVERVLTHLQDKERPFQINELLVLTFTNAAAAEMKGRIGNKLAEVYKETQDPYLEQQLNLLPSAQISTIHSFCQWVIRNYFYEMDMDPSFTIGSEGQMELLKEDILHGLIEDAYEEGLFHIGELSLRFNDKQSDKGLKEIVKRLYEYSRAMESPQLWLKSLKDDLDVEGKPFIETKWGRHYWQEKSYFEERLQTTVDTMARALNLLPEHKNNSEMLAIGEAFITNFRQCTSWNACCDLLKQTISYPRTTSLGKKATYDVGAYDLFKAAKDDFKNLVKALSTSPFKLSEEDWLKEVSREKTVIEGLVDLTNAFDEAFQLVKKKEGVLDFNDLEHGCLALLTDYIDDEGHRHPSRVALELQDTYKEVMIDEYQDTNGVQEAIIKLVSKEDRRFYVGDVKQSIYSFRQADPGLFLDKYQTFTKEEDGVTRRIDLAKNFRSHENILEGTNFIFSQLMSVEAADLDYGPEEALYVGRTVEDAPPEYVGGPIQVMIVENPNQKEDSFSDGGEDGDGESYGYSSAGANGDGDDNVHGNSNGNDAEMAFDKSIELEAYFVAKEIQKLFQSGAQVQDKDGAFRPMEYRDIVILLRSQKNKANLMVDVFRKEGIPAYAAEEAGYFEAMEVKLLLNVLSLIDNPEQDLVLASYLRSPLVGLDPNHIALLRLLSNKLHYEGHDPRKTLWNALTKAVAAYEDEKDISNKEIQAFMEEWIQGEDIQKEGALMERLTEVVNTVQGWRTRARRHSVSELIWHILEETDYVSYVSAMDNGLIRKGNVLALYDRAKEYENGNFKGLYRFIRYLEDLRDSGQDLGTAKTVSEGDNVVRILSIHKSKGLEFPVVFLCDGNKQFNMTDLKGKILFHKDAGIGIMGYFPEYNVSYPTLTHMYVKDFMKRATWAEEERVLYVALTRAKDRLYIVGTVKNIDNFNGKVEKVVPLEDHKLPKEFVLQANSYLQWIWLALARHLNGGEIRKYMDSSKSPHLDLPHKNSSWEIRRFAVDEALQEIEAMDDRTFEGAYEAYREALVTGQMEESLPVRLVNRLTYTYDYEKSTVMPAKTSVTELKSRALAEMAANVALGETVVNEKLEDAFMEAYSQQDEDYETLDELTEETLREPTFEYGIYEPNNFAYKGVKDVLSRAKVVRPKAPKALAFQRKPVWLLDEDDEIADAGSGAAFGTLMHKAMQYLPIKTYDAKSMHFEIYRLRDDGHINEKERIILAGQWEKLANFFNSPIGLRLAKAKTVKEEFSFSILLEGKEYYDAELAAGEKVFLQGIMDLIFKEEDGWILVDYKTDRVPLPEGDVLLRWTSDARKEALEQGLLTEEALASYVEAGHEFLGKRYKVQLDLYKKALEQLTGEPVKETYIYSFNMGEAFAL